MNTVQDHSYMKSEFIQLALLQNHWQDRMWSSTRPRIYVAKILAYISIIQYFCSMYAHTIQFYIPSFVLKNLNYHKNNHIETNIALKLHEIVSHR